MFLTRLRVCFGVGFGPISDAKFANPFSLSYRSQTFTGRLAPPAPKSQLGYRDGVLNAGATRARRFSFVLVQSIQKELCGCGRCHATIHECYLVCGIAADTWICSSVSSYRRVTEAANGMIFGPTGWRWIGVYRNRFGLRPRRDGWRLERWSRATAREWRTNNVPKYFGISHCAVLAHSHASVRVCAY